MAQTKPVALCTQLLPSGKLCRGIALRGQHYCRSHIRNYRLLERERQHDEAMFTLRAQLAAMDIPQLLETLEAKLNGIASIVRAYPEARQTLTIAISRLQELNNPGLDLSPEAGPRPGLASAFNPQLSSPESIVFPQLRRNQSPTGTIPSDFNEINQILASFLGSNT